MAATGTAHSVGLGGLNQSTTYHYRVISQDILGNTAASTDQAFSTFGDGDNDGDEVRAGYNPLGARRWPADNKLWGRLKGRIVLRAESRGQARYINPADGKRYYLKDGGAAYQIIKFLSLGISHENLRKIAIGN